jgi:hypothetical protein
MEISNTNQLIINRNRQAIDNQLLDLECAIENLRSRFHNPAMESLHGAPEKTLTHQANNMMVQVMELQRLIATNAGMFNAINNQVGE